MTKQCKTCLAWEEKQDYSKGFCRLNPEPVEKRAKGWCLQWGPKEEDIKDDCPECEEEMRKKMYPDLPSRSCSDSHEEHGIAFLGAKVADLTEGNEKLWERNEELQKENKGLREGRVSLRKERDELHTALEQTEDSCTKYRTERGKLKMKNASMACQIEFLEKKNRELHHEFKKLKAENERLQQEKTSRAEVYAALRRIKRLAEETLA